MRATFSEFSFGYAVTEELLARQFLSHPISPPQFPTLRQEKHFGYDVKIPLLSSWVYIQFKLCEVLVLKTAKGNKAQAPSIDNTFSTHETDARKEITTASIIVESRAAR